MKRLIAIGIVVCLWLFMAIPLSAEILDRARIRYVKNDVLLQDDVTSPEWIAAMINMPLKPGDSLWVLEESRAEIQFLEGIYLRADKETHLKIRDLDNVDNENIIIVSIDQGRTYVNCTDLSSRTFALQVLTPTFSATVSEPSRFTVNAYLDGYTEISVLDGAVVVKGVFGTTRVHAGSRFSYGADTFAELAPTPTNPQDSWHRWNRSRDSFHRETRHSSRYLPPSLHAFSSDFDKYGRWVYESDYGYVWVPTSVVSHWAPYREGRWVWINNDYVWVSYEPWGWAPYHYGRWIFRGVIGWCWVPPAVRAAFWSPGFVAWIYTPTYVAWVPLAPREIYYGYGHYGPYSVNITKVNINTIKTVNIYKNVRIKNAVTIIHMDTFRTGKRAHLIKVRKNPFLMKTAKISIGRPRIHPVKARYSPLPQKIVHKKKIYGKKHLTNNKRDTQRRKDIRGPKKTYTKKWKKSKTVDHAHDKAPTIKPQTADKPVQKGKRPRHYQKDTGQKKKSILKQLGYTQQDRKKKKGRPEREPQISKGQNSASPNKKMKGYNRKPEAGKNGKASQEKDSSVMTRQKRSLLSNDVIVTKDKHRR